MSTNTQTVVLIDMEMWTAMHNVLVRVEQLLDIARKSPTKFCEMAAGGHTSTAIANLAEAVKLMHAGLEEAAMDEEVAARLVAMIQRELSK